MNKLIASCFDHCLSHLTCKNTSWFQLRDYRFVAFTFLIKWIYFFNNLRGLDYF